MGNRDMKHSLWTNFRDNFFGKTLVTLATLLAVYGLSLASASMHLYGLFHNNPCQHPVIILREVPIEDLEAVVAFIYEGQVNVSQRRLHTFMKLAEALQIRGLTDAQNSRPKEKELYESFVSVSDNNNSSSTVAAASVNPDNHITTPQAPRAHIQQVHKSPVVTRTRVNESPPPPIASKRRRSSSNNRKNSPLRNEDENIPEETNDYKRDIQNMLEVKMEPSEYGDESEFDVEASNHHGDLNYTDQQQEIMLNAAKVSSTLTIPSSHPVFTMTPARKHHQEKSTQQSLARRNSHEKTAVQNLQPEFPQEPNCQNLPYPCPFCEKAYTSWGFRRRHIKGYHTTSPELTCKWCYTVLPSHPDWEEHVTRVHNLASTDARNGLMILDEAHMVLQIAAPTRIDTLMELIKNKKDKDGDKEDGNKKDKEQNKGSKKDTGGATKC
ncbi:unnamed protein product, partial [Meganyctiphanes norvegica]